ncbi:PLD nuclease N-terminal domain-containing protein [Microbacterium sp. P07]|uniref:PLD nuclease N-terminal domain-containing protein n=1 Tax=Microbacterium sp. P07 TaxID=3366952 RepID=UPI003747431C
MILVLPLLTLTVMVIALIDAITRDDSQVKHLPKFAWVMFIVFLPLIGSILWFTLGREWNTSPRQPMSFGDPRRWADVPPPAEARTTRSTEQQLADLEREIELHKLIEAKRAQRAADDAG